jgi:hypothetical protein
VIEPIPLVLGYGAGLAAGAVYLAALWRSIRTTGARPLTVRGVVLLGLVRIAVALAAVGGAVYAGVGAFPLVAALLGFLTIRLIATSLVRRRGLAYEPKAGSETP